MKKTNRFIALLTALVLVFSTLIGTTAFAAVNEDVVGTDFEVAVGKLKALGIMEGYPDGTFLPEGEITRAEFAKIAVMAYGLGDAAEASKGTTKFADVAGTHWAAGYINLAANRGLINGYPDGTYRPENKLTNAEAITILVRLVGLGPVVDKEGTWPANYVGRASNEGILKGVNVASGTNALRGLVAKMLANTLEVDIWGAGTYKNDGTVEYGKLGTGKNLLTEKLDITIVEEEIVDGIPQSDSSLEADEITVGGATYVNKTDYTADYLFGLEVDAWVNDDDEVIFADINTSASDVILDSVVSSVEVTSKVKLLVKDKTYDVLNAADVYVNYDSVTDLDDIQDEVDFNTVYGKVILEKGKIRFASFFSFDEVDAGLVEKVEKTEISYWAIDDDATLDLSDYDDDDEEVIVLNADLTAAKVEDIKAGKVIYAFEFDDEDLYIVIAGTEVTGKLEKVAAEEAKVAGKTYDVVLGRSTVSIDSNDNLSLYASNAADTKDLVGEQVIATLDINGDIRHISGDAKATSGALYGIAVDAYANGKYNTVEIFNKEGKTVAYNFEKKSQGDEIVDHFDTGAKTYQAVKYEINKDGEIEDGTFAYQSGTSPADLSVTTATALVKFNKDKDRIEVGATTYYFDKDTVFMSSEDNDDEEVLTWEKLKGNSATVSIAVVGDAGRAAKLVWIYDDYTDLADDDYFGIVTAAPYYDGDDWIVTVDVAGLGVKEYVGTNSYAKGDTLNFKVSSSNKIVINDSDSIAYSYVYTVTAKDGDYLTLDDGTTYKLHSDAVFYKTKDNNTKLDKSVGKSTIAVGDTIAIMEDEDIIRVVVELDTDNHAPVVMSATFTDANTLVIVFSEKVTAIAGDFTDGKTDAPGTFAVNSISGSGTATITLTVTGAPAIVTGDEGSVDIAATVEDLAGNALVTLDDYAIDSGF